MPHTLADAWRSEAALLRRRGAALQADLLESCAADLLQWIHERSLEALTLDQAAAESGYSYSALQKMAASGELQNAGKPRQPRIRRGDLPKKAARPQHTAGIADIALAARRRRAS